MRNTTPDNIPGLEPAHESRDPVDDDNFICEGCAIESDIENSIKVAGLYFCDGCAGDITATSVRH